jgi:hypothetical protein
MHRFTWPRQELIWRAARRVSARILQRWLSKDPPQAVKEGVKNWLTKELTRHEMEAEHLIGQLQDSCEKELGQSPDSLFDELVEPFVPQGKRGPDPDLDAVVATLQRMEELVGSTEPEPAGKRTPILLGDAMEQAADAVAKKWSARVSQLVFRFVEDVHYRVRGAEEAIRMLTGLIEDTLETYEPLLQEREENAVEARQRIQQMIASLEANPGGGRRNAPFVAELVDSLRLYPRCRYQSLLLRRVINVYVTLRGKLSDQVRELTLIRQRLGDLAKAFEFGGDGGASTEAAQATNLLPAGCESMDDAVNWLLRDIKPDAIHALDQAVQATINQQLTSLVQVCMTSAASVKSLEEALHRHAEEFTANRLTAINVVEMFLAHYEDNEDGATTAIVNAYQDAVPELARKLSCTEPELRVVALPASDQVADFRELVRKALPNMQLLFTDSPDDVVICREQPEVPLDALPLLGPVGKNAYRQMANSDNFSPHSREDITDWLEKEAD